MARELSGSCGNGSGWPGSGYLVDVGGMEGLEPHHGHLSVAIQSDIAACHHRSLSGSKAGLNGLIEQCSIHCLWP